MTLASLHAAKGLEWDAVFLAGMSEGLMPISLAETDEAVAEERRLLYVGITRAREHLDLSFARSRNPGGRATRKRTRFLDGLWPGEAPGRARKGAGSTGGVTTLKVSGNYDELLYEALREWRAAEAKVIDRPAFVVFSNAILQVIAEVRPTTVPELARIDGVGPSKIDAYGSSVLDLVKSYVDGTLDK